jgi:hypothetical protein
MPASSSGEQANSDDVSKAFKKHAEHVRVTQLSLLLACLVLVSTRYLGDRQKLFRAVTDLTAIRSLAQRESEINERASRLATEEVDKSQAREWQYSELMSIRVYWRDHPQQVLQLRQPPARWVYVQPWDTYRGSRVTGDFSGATGIKLPTGTLRDVSDFWDHSYVSRIALVPPLKAGRISSLTSYPTIDACGQVGSLAEMPGHCTYAMFENTDTSSALPFLPL